MTEDNKRPAQAQAVLNYMKDFGGITQVDAIKDLGVLRLSARIYELKKQGIEIESVQYPIKTRYGNTTWFKRYSIKEAQN